MVTHPCKQSNNIESIQLKPIKPFERAREMAEMGSFQVEEGSQTLLATIGKECAFSLDDLKDLNVNLEQVIQSMQIPRGNQNVTFNSNSPVGVSYANTQSVQQQQPMVAGVQGFAGQPQMVPAAGFAGQQPYSQLQGMGLGFNNGGVVFGMGGGSASGAYAMGGQPYPQANNNYVMK